MVNTFTWKDKNNKSFLLEKVPVTDTDVSAKSICKNCFFDGKRCWTLVVVDCSGIYFKLIKEITPDESPRDDYHILSRMNLITTSLPNERIDVLIYKKNYGFSIAYRKGNYWKRRPSSKSDLKVLDSDLWIELVHLY